MAGERNQLLVTFGYDGSRFCGLAPQPDQVTAGATLKDRFLAAGVYPKGLNFSSRTDAGVHAIRNLATCFLKGPADIDAVITAVTAPRDDGLRSVAIHRVPRHVHARAIAAGKHYRYLIDDGWGESPATTGGSWCVAPSLEPLAMSEAARHLVGEHDFASFCARRSRARQSSWREITEVTVETKKSTGQGARRGCDPNSQPAKASSHPGKRLVIDVRGNSFLRHMVRIMVGTLAEVGAGLRSPKAMPAVLAARRRSASGPTAPAHGLTLVQVYSTWPLPPLEHDGES